MAGAAGIVGQQMAAAGELFFCPADPGITRAQVPGRGAPAQQCQLLALILDDISPELQTLPDCHSPPKSVLSAYL